MKICKFTAADDNQTPVYVNPDKVVWVIPFGKFTKIVFGAELHSLVKEKAVDVATAVENLSSK